MLRPGYTVHKRLDIPDLETLKQDSIILYCNCTVDKRADIQADG